MRSGFVRKGENGQPEAASRLHGLLATDVPGGRTGTFLLSVPLLLKDLEIELPHLSSVAEVQTTTPCVSVVG